MKSVREIITEILLTVSAGAWLFLCFIFLAFAVFAFIYPESFNKYSVGLGFLGLSIAFLVNFVYLSDKIDSFKENKTKKENDNNKDKCLENIDRICKQWDLEKTNDMFY